MNEEFEEKVRLVYDYIHAYGLTKSGLSFNTSEELKKLLKNKKKRLYFNACVHEGYRKGQDIIIEELIWIERAISQLNSEIKTARSIGDKQAISRKKSAIEILKYQEAVMRNLADSLAWVLFKRQHWIARRWFSGKMERPSLLNSNIESLHEVAKNYYNQNPNGFVLYCDITSFIDISDLIYVNQELQITPVEVKEGAMSTKVLDLIDKVSQGKDIKPEELGLEDLKNPKKFFSQVERTLNQMTKSSRVVNLWNNEEGPDAFTGKPTKIYEIVKPLEHYHEEIYDMFKTLKRQDWDFRTIEGVVCISMHKGLMRFGSDYIFRHAVKNLFSEDFPIIHYNSQLIAPIKEPIFQKPYGLDNIMDVISGRVKVLLSVDFNAFMKVLESKGMKVKWMSRKETHKQKESGGRHRLFVFQNRAIEISYNGKTSVLGDGVISRMVYDSQTPHSVADMLMESMTIQNNKPN